MTYVESVHSEAVIYLVACMSMGKALPPPLRASKVTEAVNCMSPSVGIVPWLDPVFNKTCILRRRSSCPQSAGPR